MEPHWRRLLAEFGGRLAWRYRMGGMIPDWSSYSDPLNSVSRPVQMGALWFQVRQATGVRIDDRIWLEDPPASSYLPCVAVKAAGLQSPWAAERYLSMLREAVMTGRRNIARRKVLIELAEQLARTQPDRFDVDALTRDLDSPEALAAFRDDLSLAQYRNIGRFPTLTLQSSGGTGAIVVGYRPYEALLAALIGIAPTLTPNLGERESSDAVGSSAHNPV